MHACAECSLQEALELTLSCAKKAGYSAVTVNSFKGNLRTFINWCSSQGIHRVNAIDLDLLKAHFMSLKERRLSGYTVKSRKRSLKYLFDCLLEEKMVLKNLMDDLKIRPHLIEKVWDVLTLSEMGALLAVAEEKCRQEKCCHKNTLFRDKLILMVLIATGIRSCELTALKIKDVDIKRRTLHIHGKGSNWYVKRNRLAFIDEESLVSELSSFMESAEPEDYLFTTNSGNRLRDYSIYTIITKLGRYASLKKKVTPHLLRHSFCTFLITQGADAFSVQRLMGHWQVQTTLKFYLHLTPEEVKNNWKEFNPLAGGDL